MRVYPHLFAKLFASPLLIQEPVRIALERELLARMGLTPATPAPKAYDDYDDEPARRMPEAGEEDHWRMRRVFERFGPVAVVTIDGVIDKHLSDGELDCYGGVDLADVDQALSLCQADANIEYVILAMNSPGGSCMGVPETAARVAALRREKEVIAYTDGICASAAYYIASQADRFAITQSAVLGSIGVYLAVLDQSRALEMDGYKVELIKAGRLKAMGASFKPLTDEERAVFQAEVDRIYSEFTKAVVAGRGAVDKETMQGQCFRGPLAIAANLADELVPDSLDEFVANLLSVDTSPASNTP